MIRFPIVLITLAAVTLLTLLIGCDDDRLLFTPEEPYESYDGVRLTIENPVFDFGFTPQYSQVSHEFWLKSTGTDTLRILDIRPG